MAFMLSDVLHEAVGHGLNALLTGAQTEVKTGFMPEARESRSVIRDTSSAYAAFIKRSGWAADGPQEIESSALLWSPGPLPLGV